MTVRVRVSDLTWRYAVIIALACRQPFADLQTHEQADVNMANYADDSKSLHAYSILWNRDRAKLTLYHYQKRPSVAIHMESANTLWIEVRS